MMMHKRGGVDIMDKSKTVTLQDERTVLGTKLPNRAPTPFDAVIDDNPWKSQYIDQPLEVPPEHGKRFNTGKLNLSLLSPYADEEICKVLMFGEQKYDAWNWEKGLSFTDTINSLERHIRAFKKGENLDEESGLHHLAHAGCNIMFLLHFIAQCRTDLDDRHFKTEE